TSEIGGKSYEWSRFDTLHTPSYIWPRHRNTGKTAARLLALSGAPLVEGFGLSLVEGIGEEPPPPEGARRGGPVPAAGREGRRAHREPLRLAPALQRLKGQAGDRDPHAHVGVGHRDDAGVHGSCSAVRGRAGARGSDARRRRSDGAVAPRRNDIARSLGHHTDSPAH